MWYGPDLVRWLASRPLLSALCSPCFRSVIMVPDNTHRWQTIGANAIYCCIDVAWRGNLGRGAATASWIKIYLV